MTGALLKASTKRVSKILAMAVARARVMAKALIQRRNLQAVQTSSGVVAMTIPEVLAKTAMHDSHAGTL